MSSLDLLKSRTDPRKIGHIFRKQIILKIPTHTKNLERSLTGPYVSFSSCQQNLIKTFQIEGIIAQITKMDLIFS